MSRSSRRDQRLHLYDLGNDRCPICRTAFERTGVEAGLEVTLEHVPPTSFQAGGILGGRVKPGHFQRPETGVEFYFTASCVRKSVWTLVRQLRGPHFSTCA